MEQDDKFQVVVINNNITQHQSLSWLVLFSWGNGGGGMTYEFGSKEIVKGSGYISRQC